MDRRLLLAVGASALVVAASLPAATFAAGPDQPTRRIDVSRIDPSLRPSVRQATTVSVILQLDGRPAIQAGLTQAAQRNRARGLVTAQKAIAAAVARRGASVVARYQYTYNGLRVRTSTDRLPELAAIPGVVAIHPVRVYERTNTNGVPYVGGPATWASGATGDGAIIAVIDTGIDYTHANFGGAGTEGAYAGNDRTVIEPASFPTTKVIGGYDFAGDGYDADGDLGSVTPVPDPDPMDCGGHGSHVAGTAAGFGVLGDHSTYKGLYTADTIAGNTWTIGPGVAPEAKLMALKVFGCEGSTDLVVEALEWVGAYNASHTVGIDVVNMSLGSLFGSNTDPDAVQTNNLVASGVTVVASAGNSGPVGYITGTPAAATRAISVAALDSLPTIPLAAVRLPTGDVPAINMNAHPGLPVGGTTVHILSDGAGGLKLGCSAGDFDAATSGKVVAVRRGTCAFVEKGDLAAAAGAVGIIVVNRDGLDVADDELPAFLGYNPEIFDIPMIGVARNRLATIVAADGAAVTLAATSTAANPTYKGIAGFSSSGPRWGDSWLKADLAAPGVSVLSTAVGSGFKGTMFSGTSMAAPMTAGAAALVIQAHPGWSPLMVKAALSNTASTTDVQGYSVLRSGSGVIQVNRASDADVVATTSDGTASLSYGYVQALGAWSSAKRITITNTSNYRVVYALASSSSTVKLSASTIAIGAHSSATVTATAALSAYSVNALCSPDTWNAYKPCSAPLTARSGAVTATPVGARPGQYALRVPFLIVPRGASILTATRGTTWTKSSGRISGRLVLRNTGGHAGTADVYALGTTDPANDAKVLTTVTPVKGTDIRATGVQVLPASTLMAGLPASDRAIYFAVNMHDRFSTAAVHEVDVYVDTTGDGVPEFLVFGYDYGALTTGAFSGEWVSFVVDLNQGPNGTIIDGWAGDAPMNGSTVLLSAAASDLGLAAGSGSFRYKVVTWDGFTGAKDETGMSRAFDAYAPRQSTGQLRTVAKGTSSYVGAWFYRVTNVRGWLVVTMDDRNGAAQADIVGLPSTP
jgi:subtilisin family serine protease